MVFRKEELTRYDVVIVDSRFHRDYHFDVVILYRKDIEAKHWYEQVVFLDVCNKFHN